MTIDAISNMATIIRNAIAIKNSVVTLPYTKNNEIIAEILAKEGFIHCVATTQKMGPTIENRSPRSFMVSSTSAPQIAKQFGEHKNNNEAESFQSSVSAGSDSQEKQTNLDTENQNHLSPPETKEDSASNDGGTVEQNAAQRQPAINSNALTKSLDSQDKDGPSYQKPSVAWASSQIYTNQKEAIILALKYVGRQKNPMIHAIKRVSKPSLKWYAPNPLPQSLGGLGIFIVSTSYGIITDKEAREKKVGGEILLEIW